MRMKKVFLMCLLMASPMITSAVMSVSNVKAHRLHPLGGVAISYEVIDGINTDVEVVVTAKDNVSGKVYSVSRNCLSGDAGMTSGTHRIIWDMEAQGLALNLEKVTFTVACYMPYMVIDLSAGPNATKYQYSYLSEVPAGGWSDEYKRTKLVLRLIIPGSFKMRGVYDVTLSKPYYMGIFEVTGEQYGSVMGYDRINGLWDGPVHTAWSVIRGDSKTHNWPAVKTVANSSFVGRLRARTGLTFDLPTDAQWEYACRAGTTTRYYWGDSWDDAYGWINDNSRHPVGEKIANAWELYDMCGNAREWCLDYFMGSEKFDFVMSGSGWKIDWEGKYDGTHRIVRGGKYGDDASLCAMSSWQGVLPDDLNCGFRLVRIMSE